MDWPTKPRFQKRAGFFYQHCSEFFIATDKKDPLICPKYQDVFYAVNSRLRCGFFMKLFFLLLVVVIASGCATKLKVNMLQPAQHHQASLTKTVAVLPFEGKRGREMASEIEAALSNINIDDKQYFTIVDRASIDKIMNELKFSNSSLTDPEHAIQIGQMVSAQGIYAGTVTALNCKDSYYQEQRQKCAQHAIKRDKKGNTYEGECIRWNKFNVNCTKRVANVAVTPKLVEVATGKIIYSKNLSGMASSSGCEDTNPPKGETELLQQAKEQIKQQLRKDIAPYYVTVEIKLMDSTDGIDSKTAKDNLSAGIEAAGKNRLDMACELWGTARIQAPSAPSLLYNLGVCAESRGDADAALALYKQADKFHGKPHEDITAAMQRTITAINNKKKLEDQLK